MTDVLLRGKFGRRATEGEKHVTTEAESGVLHLQAKGRQGLLAPVRGWEGGLEQTLLQRIQRAPILPTP